MDLSIIIPIYNTWANVDRILKKIYLNNKSFKFETILIDDFSKNIPHQLVKRIKKNYNPNIFFLKKNNGPGYARDLGIKKAKGKFIWLVDSDDMIKDIWSQTFCNFIDSRHKVDFVSFNSITTHHGRINNEDQGFVNIPPNKINSIKKIFEKNKNFENVNSTVWRFWFNKDFIKKNKIFFGKHRHFEDVTFLNKVFFNSKYFIKLNEVCYEHLRNENSLSSSIKILKSRSLNFYYDLLHSIFEIVKLISKAKKKFILKFLIYRCSRDLADLTSYLLLLKESDELFIKIHKRWKKLALQLSNDHNKKNKNLLVKECDLFLSSSLSKLKNHYFDLSKIKKKIKEKPQRFFIHCHSVRSIICSLLLRGKNLKFLGFVDTYDNNYIDPITKKKVVGSLSYFKKNSDLIFIINRKKKISKNIRKNYLLNGFLKKNIIQI